MHDEIIPDHKIGVLAPRSVIENQPYEFYRMAPPRVILVMIPMGLREFSPKDLKRITSGLDEKLELLMERDVEIIVASGVPLPLLLGVEGHDQLLAYIHSYTGVRATSSIECVTAAAQALNITRLVVANKWSDDMNGSLAAFFARDGLEIVGVASEPMQPREFDIISSQGNADLALGLGRRGFTEHPEAEALYIGGGSWLSQPVSEQLETEYGKPVFCNQGAHLRHLLKEIGMWQPIEGHGKLLSLV